MSNYKRLGDYIQLVDKRNTDSKVTLLRVVSTRKVLIESVANMTGVSLHNYKIVEHNQFVYVADTSRRSEKIGLALNDSKKYSSEEDFLVPLPIPNHKLKP